MGCRVVKFTLGPAHRVGAKHLDPRIAWAYGNRGLAYGALGQYDRALADFDQAIALDPRFALAYGNRGLAYKSKGTLAEALADFRLALDPASPPARERLEAARRNALNGWRLSESVL